MWLPTSLTLVRRVLPASPLNQDSLVLSWCGVCSQAIYPVRRENSKRKGSSFAVTANLLPSQAGREAQGEPVLPGGAAALLLLRAKDVKLASGWHF